MQFGSVTFVLSEAILRKVSAKVTHHPVARDLGDYAGRGNAQADAIAVDDRRLRKRKRNHRQSIDQNVIRWLNQGLNRQAHGAVTRAQNVDPIYLNRINNADSPSNLGIRNEFGTDLFAQFRRKLFGIVQPTMPEFFVENHCSRDDWTGQRAPASFVNPGDARDSDRAELFLVTESAASVHPRKSLADLR